MDPYDFGPGCKMVLVKDKKRIVVESKGKIIIVTNEENENGWQETSSSKISFENNEKATKKAQRIIFEKLMKGYSQAESNKIKPEKEKYKGDYLENGKRFYVIQVNKNQVREESSEGERAVYQLKTEDLAIEKAKKLVREILARGFKRNPEKFKYTFDSDELSKTLILNEPSIQNTDNILDRIEAQIEYSEDEQEVLNELEIPSNPLKKSQAIDIEDFSAEKALHVSSLNPRQIVEDEENNGVLTSYVFEVPESEGTSPITEILEEPQKRNRSLPTIQEMLATVNLSRYVLNFEDKRISSEQFLSLTDSNLHELGLPKRARSKILNSISKGEWDPFLTSSIVLPHEEEEKFNKKREFETLEVPKNFRIERGKNAPEDFIQVLLAHQWSEGDPTGWWMSEKLDGVRAYWNGKALLSRNGNKFFAPKFFIEKLPKTVSLDGEIWMGRKMFEDTISIVKRQDESKYDFNEWAKLVYVLFDAPSIKEPFEKRLEYIECLDAKLQSPYLRAHEHYVCRGQEHMEEEADRIDELGGEGIMLREPNSKYERRRSKTLLKVKKFHDEEATVISIEPGTGRCAGMMGAIRVRADDGREFKIGSGFNDQQRRKPPKIGTRVTYKYQELSKNGIPRFPIYLRNHPGF